MNKPFLAFSIAFASALSIGYAQDPDMIRLLPVVPAPNAPAPVIHVASDAASTSTSTFNQLASDLAAAQDQEQGSSELTLNLPSETSQPDLADTDLEALYVYAVKAQRAAHLKSIRLAKAAALKTGYLVAANAAFDATHPISTDTRPAATTAPSDTVAQVNNALNYDPMAGRQGDLALDNLMATPLSDGLVATPEPSSMALFFAGATFLFCFMRRRAAKPTPAPVKAVR